MKILVLSNYRGSSTARPEAEIFIGLKQQGHDVTIMTYGDADYNKRFEENEIKVIPFYPEIKRDKKSIEFIRQELIDGDYDIFQMFTSMGYLNGIPAAKGLPVKVVLYRGYTGNIAWYDPFMYMKYFHPRVDGVVCLVEAIRKIFVKNAPWANNKFRTINKGHDIHWYKVDDGFDLTSFGVKPNDTAFICAANDRKMKGVTHLLKATHFLEKDTPLHLFLAGNGMDKGAFLDLIDQSPIKDKIHILGFRDNILEIVKACDIFVLASLYGEAITKAVIESMALGKAPLITDIPGNKNLVINGESGIVVPPANPKAMADAMKTYLKQPDLIEKYGKAAQNRIQTAFHTSRTVKEYEAFYTDLINSKNR
jgi:glycosyltransferase involved in cell wall biosynthesis